MSSKAKKKTILIVDDVAENLDVIREVLALDYKIKAAINGELALKIAKKQQPDLILLDIIMPEMDGYQVCRQLKTDKATKEIPVIFLTSMDSIKRETKGLELGAVDYIKKPINPAILKARINTHLELSTAKKKLFSQKQELKSLYQELNQEVNKTAKIHERNFLAELPDCKALSLAAYFEPAKRLGGDFYNFIHLDDKLIIYLSDVTGHSLEGIVFNAFVKETIASYVQLADDKLTPKAILTHLYQQYRKNNYPDDYFVCIFLAVLDLNSKDLSYTGAGFQNSPLLSTNDGKQLLLESSGPPISSAIPAELMDFKNQYLKLKAGTTIFFSTDGIMEQINGEINYEQRLKALFYNNSHKSPQEIVELVKKDFREFNNYQQADDDITYIVVESN